MQENEEILDDEMEYKQLYDKALELIKSKTGKDNVRREKWFIDFDEVAFYIRENGKPKVGSMIYTRIKNYKMAFRGNPKHIINKKRFDYIMDKVPSWSWEKVKGKYEIDNRTLIEKISTKGATFIELYDFVKSLGLPVTDEMNYHQLQEIAFNSLRQ